MNFFIKSLEFKGFPVSFAQEQLKLIQRLSEEDFHKWQEGKKWAIFQHHSQGNVNYRTWVETAKHGEIKNWNDIPVLKKSCLQIPLENRMSHGYSKKNVYLNSTSGSSGQPFYFVKDKFCHAMTWASIIDRYGWHGLEYGRSLQARFYGISLSPSQYWIERLKDRLAARVRFPVFDLAPSMLKEYAKRFQKIPFVYINGYTSSLVLFSKYLISQGIVLRELCPSLRLVITTSEVLGDLDRESLKKAFGVPVVNEYGASEVDIIAFEDVEFDWLIGEENLYVEILDENDQPVSDGEEGRVIVTALHNRAMPLIRYELGDIGAISRKRKGKYRILERLQGRTNDVALLPSGKVSPGLTFYYISKSLLESGGYMKEFIIRQVAIDQFHYEYVADREMTDDDKQKVIRAMDLYLEKGLRATFERKEKIERTKAGKLRSFQALEGRR